MSLGPTCPRRLQPSPDHTASAARHGVRPAARRHRRGNLAVAQSRTRRPRNQPAASRLEWPGPGSRGATHSDVSSPNVGHRTRILPNRRPRSPALDTVWSQLASVTAYASRSPAAAVWCDSSLLEPLIRRTPPPRIVFSTMLRGNGRPSSAGFTGLALLRRIALLALRSVRLDQQSCRWLR